MDTLQRKEYRIEGNLIIELWRKPQKSIFCGSREYIIGWTFITKGKMLMGKMDQYLRERTTF